MDMRTINSGIDVPETVAGMKPGEQKVYHVGCLAYDRLQEGPWSRMVDLTAGAAYAAYQRGEVTLVQRKLSPLKYEYVMVRLPSR